MEKTQQRSLKAAEHVANTKSSPTVPQNWDKDLNLVTITEQDINKQETAEQKDLQSSILPDGAEVSLEDIERCYDMGRVVGDGNFAVVRECRVRGLAEMFAMKIVDNAKLQGRGNMIQNEIALLRNLEHPRLIQLFRSHHTDTHVYLLMELVTGGDLFDAITQSGRFTEPSAACMIRDISQALECIHSKSIAHRDIKPENLLRHGNGSLNLKLADFGLAMVVTEPVFTVCGTPTYVAPEILAETGYGVGVDVWAMGVILFVLLGGIPPFRSPDRNQEELFRLIQKGEVHFLSPYWDNKLHIKTYLITMIQILMLLTETSRFKRFMTRQATSKMHPMQKTPPPRTSNIPQISTNLRNQHSKKTLTQNKSDLLSNELKGSEEASVNKGLVETNYI
uniref:Doublecortin like kinase 3 n=1 Tax=Sinocyclocheilus grahami TaxID=75366 RepID=A0A672LIZ5_SINGR